MKGLCKTPAAAIAAAILAGCLPALAVPRYWEADVAAPSAWHTAAYRGESVQLTARLVRGREPFAVPEGAAARILVSTNDFRDGCWEWPAAVSTSGVVRATWTPDMDPGAPAVRIFLAVSESGTNVNYGANCAMRLLGSPGAVPNVLPLPAATIDFAAVRALNAPWLEEEADPVASAWLDASTNAQGAVKFAAHADDADYAGYANHAAYAETAYGLYDTAVVGRERSAAWVIDSIEAAGPAATNYTDAVAAGLSPTGHVHDAADIASGTLSADRIPSLTASKITSGTLSAARLPAATASTLGAVRPDNATLSVASGVLSAPYLTNRLYRADEIDAVASGLALRDDLIADLSGFSSSREVWVRRGPDASEGPTLFSGGAERHVCHAWWQRWNAPEPAPQFPATWLMQASFSAAPARATREGGAALDAFLDLPDVPLGAGGHFATNCLPSGLPTQYASLPGWPSARPCYVVCANVNTDVPATLTMGGVAVSFPASNGVVQVRNVAVPADGGSEVAVDAEPGGAVSLALAVNPWVEFKSAGGWGAVDGGETMPHGGTNAWTMFAWRFDYDGAGTARSRLAMISDAGDWTERTNTVSGLPWGARMPPDIRFRTCFAGFYGGLRGREVWRYGVTRVMSGDVDDAALYRLWRRGRDDLRARGLWTALPQGADYWEE